MERIILIRLLCGIRFLCLCGVSGQNCAGKKPIIVPPALVVKYGGPALATCHAQYSVSMIGWEATVGAKAEENTQQLVWSVNSTDWLLSAGITCYTNSDEQCETRLPITIYQTPGNVTFLLNHTGPLLEGQQYELECVVQSVAPVDKLTIIWYRGDTELERTGFPKFTIWGDQAKNSSVSPILRINASREDHGVPYSCAATLDLNTTEPIPDTRSSSVQLKVYYKPKVLTATGNITIDEGQELKLSCKGDANPSPTYEWTHNSVVLGNNDTLIIDSVTADNKGVYKCLIRNNQGEVSAEMEVSVEMKGNQTGIIIGVMVMVIALLVAGVMVWKKCIKR